MIIILEGKYLSNLDKKIIKFTPTYPNEEFLSMLTPPVEASKKIPQWYKDLCSYGGTSTDLKDLMPVNDRSSDGSNVSTKLCLPFLDSMLSGYIYSFEDDLTVELDSDGSPNFYWTKDFGMMDKRFEVDMAIPDNVYPVQFGIKMNWYYETPPGYSLLFTHPFNRPELPFYVPSGIVDSDIWGLPIFIPFFIKRGFEGVIKAGTPLIQMLPIKREAWSIEIDSSKESIERNKIREEKRRSHITAHYKKTTWQRKQY